MTLGCWAIFLFQLWLLFLTYKPGTIQLKSVKQNHFTLLDSIGLYAYIFSTLSKHKAVFLRCIGTAEVQWINNNLLLTFKKQSTILLCTLPTSFLMTSSTKNTLKNACCCSHYCFSLWLYNFAVIYYRNHLFCRWWAITETLTVYEQKITCITLNRN